MEVFLYNSAVCRLCGEENESGNLLFSSEENSQNISELINAYLPVKVSDDGCLPRTVCPGCTIQLEAMVEFMNLIIKGQVIIRELLQREKEFKRALGEARKETEFSEINTNCVYSADHPLTLQLDGNIKPKRRRGRPTKKPKTLEEIASEQEAAKEVELKKIAQKAKSDAAPSGKRKRKTPTRFSDVVQGKELEKILQEEGVTDGEDSDTDVKAVAIVKGDTEVGEPEVIGHLEVKEGLVAVINRKGRGRPKGSSGGSPQQCALCNMVFSHAGRYMSHVAAHGRVLYECAECAITVSTRIELNQHQESTGHKGMHALQYSKNDQITNNTTAQKDVEEKPSTKEPLEQVEEEKQPVNDELKDQLSLQPLDDVVQETVINSDQADGSSQVVEENDVTDKKTADSKPKLKCDLCDKLFGSKQAKSLHIKAVHENVRPYICKVCGATFAYPRSLRMHSVKHRPRRKANGLGYACDLCGKVLNHPSSVKYHKEAEHALNKYVCNKCNKTFKHKQLLRRHQLVHTQAKPYACKLCPAAFKSKTYLLNHEPIHSGVCRFSCELCKQEFRHRTSLTLHMRWHAGLKPFKCNTCGRSFSQRSNLSEHERIHSGAKPYHCAYCERKFTTSSQRRLHERRHAVAAASAATTASAPSEADDGSSTVVLARPSKFLPRRLHPCNICPKAFADKFSLNRHKKQVHKQIINTSLLNDNTTSISVDSTTEPIQPTVINSLLSKMNQSQQAAFNQDLTAIDPRLSSAHNQLSAMDTQITLSPQVVINPQSDIEEEDEDSIIYVAYDVDGTEASNYQIIESEQEESLPGDVNLLSCCPVYPNEELVQEAEQISVTDEEGNPLHFTMQDGTRLAITSADGKSLQVVTHDGQAIPVEINGFSIEENQIDTSDTMVHQFHLQKEELDFETNSAEEGSPVSQYYTIV